MWFILIVFLLIGIRSRMGMRETITQSHTRACSCKKMCTVEFQCNCLLVISKLYLKYHSHDQSRKACLTKFKFFIDWVCWNSIMTSFWCQQKMLQRMMHGSLAQYLNIDTCTFDQDCFTHLCMTLSWILCSFTISRKHSVVPLCDITYDFKRVACN